MSPGTSVSFLRVLCSLRWLAIAGQASTVLLAGSVLALDLPVQPLCAGIAALVVFNIYATMRLRGTADVPYRTAFGHTLVDMVVLAWMIGWSGGVANPFGLMFLILIGLAAISLPRDWALAALATGVASYAAACIFGRPLIGREDVTLMLWGMVANFLISVPVVFYFTTRLAEELRSRERELALLRERFTRNEGIVALATHAAAMAHELNTPLATMTLLADEIALETHDPEVRNDADTLRQLLVICRERVRNLALPTEVDLATTVSQWRLVRPAVVLQRTGAVPETLRVDPAVGHLLQALLNNAADAGAEAGDPRVELHLEYRDHVLSGEVRDHGKGFDPAMPVLPAAGLFQTSKPGGLGVGLALSHATVEQLGGHMTMVAAEGGGTCIRFHLPLDGGRQEFQS
jgi:two-component system sensor histidine kinase RegB